MCTAITFSTKDHYFGRNLDLEVSFGQQVVVTPRNYKFDFRQKEALTSHYAMIGVASVMEGYPLYFDAVNEKGLGMAGLNYAGNCDYKDPVDKEGIDNIASFEFIPWILGQCADVTEAREKLSHLNLTNINFNAKFPASPLHWLLGDKKESIVVECDKDGLHVYDNPVGTLTNNPPFPKQLFNLNNYHMVSPHAPQNFFNKDLPLADYSRGLGSRALPGGMDSEGRFVKVSFTKWNSVCGSSEAESVGQFFHILHSVEQQKGLDEVVNTVGIDSGKEDQFEYTIYSSCCNQDKGIFYYTTYNNNQINGVDMHKTDLDSQKLTAYPMIDDQQINMQN